MLAEDPKDSHPVLRKLPSNVSLSALRPVSPSGSNIPVTPSLTTGASVTTDDEETDFQSAYSTSPRASYGNFDNYVIRPGESNSEQGTPTYIAKEYLDDISPSNRERASSTATAKGPVGSARSSIDTPIREDH